MAEELEDTIEMVRKMERSHRGVISATAGALDTALANRDWNLIEATARILHELAANSERISP